MNKLWVIILIIILIIAGYYLWNGSKSADTGEVGGPGAMKVDAGAFTGSLGDLAKRGGDYECKIATSAEGVETAGKVYVSGNQVRGEFTSQVEGSPMESHMLQSGDGYTYVWSSAFPQGFKTATPAQEATGDKPVAPSGDFFDANLDYSWDCAPWTVDQALFKVPAEVKFLEAPALAQ